MSVTDLKPQFTVYAPFEVIVHNTPEDCWLSFLGKVFDVTSLVKLHKDEDCVKPILAFAGKDVSHWFDEKTGDIRYCVHPVTGARVPYCPHGPIPDVQVQVPSTDWKPNETLPWWMNNEKYQIGVLTKQVRPIRIINMLIVKEVTMNVCCEDTFNRISERYSLFNSEPESYTWYYRGNMIKMNKTMDENGIPDEREKMAELGIPKSYYTPSVQLYYNDNLKHLEDITDDEDELDKEICCVCKQTTENQTV